MTIFLILCQEVLYMNLSNEYFLQLETWIKFSSVCLAVILPFTTRLTLSEVVWPRHVATAAILLSWLEMMFLLSRFPRWGYYVLMFGKVSTKVLKILLTFAFLLIGFALSFMIQFHCQKPFESPWAALVKTIVMMTSEFDYGDLVEETDPKVFVKSLLVVRVIILMFVIFTAIVLMNLMVGVAVNDLQNLEVVGNVRRLAKQVELIGILENLHNGSRFDSILPYWLKNVLQRKKCRSKFVIRPNETKSKNYKALPSHIREALFEKAQCRRK
uniref:Ion transport domain-containing protein n=1 Tax=Heliothis virescens TaxID=7102 RepID=A0A2A4IVG4_HELVI